MELLYTEKMDHTSTHCSNIHSRCQHSTTKHINNACIGVKGHLVVIQEVWSPLSMCVRGEQLPCLVWDTVAVEVSL